MIGQQAGTDITKISAGNTKYRRAFLFFPLLVSIEIIELLREPSCHIDRIGRSEEKLSVKGSIGKSLLHHYLTVIKASVYFQGRYVLSKGSELQFLDFAHLSGRVKDHHINRLNTIKSVCNGAPGISGSGNKYGYLSVRIFYKMTQAAAHKFRAYILKGQGRPMEELQ